MAEIPAASTPSDPTINRLEDQIRWYGSRSRRNQQAYKGLKLVSLVLAGAIPVLAAVAAATDSQMSPALTAAIGAALLAIESIQQLNQYHENWISYRTTGETLKHEKYLYLALAGSYGRSAKPHALLAMRVEGLISQEHGRWRELEEQLVQDEHQAT